jgi:HEAT repeat protein
MLTRLALLLVAGAGLLAASAPAADTNAERTRKLIEVLQSNAALYDKARACQQLGEFGTREAVPALAALLGDEHLCAYARNGLEGIRDPSAAEALRNAAARLTGDRLAGVVESLGVLRDTNAVDLLHKLADDPASGVSQPAMLALGRIANDASTRILREVLAQAAEGTRTNAAAACLLAAQEQLADSHADSAAALCDAIRQANVPLVYQAAAIRGAIVARKAAGVPLLVEQLQSQDPILRNAALTAIREIPCEELARALNTEINQAPANLQKQLLMALVDCHNAQSLELLQAKTVDVAPEIRQTALAVLGRIGGANEVGVLVKAVAQNQSAQESALALNALGQMQGAPIDAQLLKALTASADLDLRIKLIRLLASHSATNAIPELLKQAAGPEVKVSVAALNALQSLAGPSELPALLALTKDAKDTAVREAAESAVVGACTKAGSTLPGTEAVLAELKQTNDPSVKNSWVNILVSLGDSKALPAALAAVNDPDAAVSGNALEQLARWPDPAPVEPLLAVVQKDADPSRRKRALASAIRLATVAADERQRPAETLVRWFQQANDAAQTIEDRRLIISGLGRLADHESLELLLPFLQDPKLQEEAAVAIVQVAPALRADDPPALKEALDQIASTAKNKDLRDQAAGIAKNLPGPGRWKVLFDGHSLTGWEGNTNVWRVRDGVIVGGSLAGNPQNEFLATVTSYTNFVLRLEYKLVGTEGFVNSGVQFRSIRLQQPANEMCGFQADIGAGYSGCLYDESRRNKFLVQAPAEQIKRLEKPGDWNRYEVRCAGPRIQIVLNGEKTVDYIESDPALPLEGLFGLQMHGGNKAEVSFRNITIEEIAYGTANRDFGVPKSRWKILSFSSENTQFEDERAVLAIDGNPNTFWHTLWSGGNPGHPHHIAVDMAEDMVVTGFTYLPRQDGRQIKGVIGEFEFYVSRDPNDWGRPVATGRFDKIEVDPRGRLVLMTRAVTGRYFKLVSLSAPGGEPFAGAAEVGVLGLPAAK